MIFPNSPISNNLNAAHIPQFFNPTTVSLPFCYNGTQINYRDSSWLKLTICEMFLKNECPNGDNCSLAHPSNTVKIENSTVTVCYDYIKKKDCKHGNCKYYHPHDALASAILRRGDDSKRNGNVVNNLGLNIGMRNPLQVNRSHDLLSIQTPNVLSSSQINNNIIMSDSQVKNKLEVMRQLNAINGSAWLPGLNFANAQTLVSPTNQTNVSMHSLLPGVSAKSSMINQLGVLSASSNSTLNPSIGNIINTDIKVSGKRAATEAFGSNSNSGKLMPASSDNNYTGIPDQKKVKNEESDQSGEKYDVVDPGVSVQYLFPQVINSSAQQLQSTGSLTMSVLGGANINNPYNLLQSTPIQTAATLTPYAHLSPLTLNNLMVQSMMAANHSVTANNHNLETLLGLTSQKVYPLPSTYSQINMAQMSLLNQLYYQHLYQASLSNQTQLLYPGSLNIAELQQRSFEETSVAFINDKGTILETLPVCKDFLQGKCKRNQSCNYVHLLDTHVEVKDNKLTVCKNALKGQCHRPVCKFYHIPSYQLQKLGFPS